MKRALDVAASLAGLLLGSVVLLPLMLLIWMEDRHSPVYFAPRIGMRGREFRMLKLRSMVPNADATGIDSTSATDARVTRVGGFVRRFKLDEVPQLANVLVGDMSLVGPRPNVRRETALYTPVEQRLLDVRPGITDLASIVFSDLGEVLRNAADANIAYNQLVRPGKSRLGIFYIEHRSLVVDLRICLLTAVSMFSRPRALGGVQRLLRELGAPPDLVHLAGRTSPLLPAPPPGSDTIVTTRSPDARRDPVYSTRA